MAVQIDATQPRILPRGGTARQAVEGFVNLRFTGIEDLVKSLEDAAGRCLRDPNGFLQKAAIEGLRPVAKSYKSKISNVTGNLSKSVQVRRGRKKYEGVYIAVTGPTHVVQGKDWDVEERGAGNHAWLVEFGTQRRRPSTQNRRTYLRVHEQINGRFRAINNRGGGQIFNNEQFERMGRGYYFLMGSINEPTRQRRRGSGYPHDFVPDGNGGTRPFHLAPGETYGRMPATHPMERAIGDSQQAVLSAVRASLSKFIAELSR